MELESGQTFVIAGLLNNSITETLPKIPGIGDIPLLGKLFQSKTLSKNNTELLVIVTPEAGAAHSAGPAGAGAELSEAVYEHQHPGVTDAPAGYRADRPGAGDAPVPPMPVERLIEQKRQQGQAALPLTHRSINSCRCRWFRRSPIPTPA